MNNLKLILLNTNLFEDNNYLNEYCQLIEFNKNNKEEKFKTQSHHFIPISYYTLKYNIKKKNNQNDEATIKADSDINNFRVNLLYKDHILAHYYLCLCTKGKLKYLLNIAFINMSQILSSDFDLIKNSLDNYQKLYEEYNREKSESYKHKDWKVSKYYSNLPQEEKSTWGKKVNEGRKHLNWETTEEIRGRISKEDLEIYYIKENHSKEETAKYFKTNNSKIDELMIYYNLHKFRTKQNCLNIINQLTNDIEKIKHLYLIENYTQKDLAILYNCNVNTIQSFLHDSKIYKRESYIK